MDTDLTGDVVGGRASGRQALDRLVLLDEAGVARTTDRCFLLDASPRPMRRERSRRCRFRVSRQWQHRRPQGGAVLQQDFLQRVRQIAHQMPAVGTLDDARCPLPRTIRIGWGTVPGDMFHAGMLAQPGRERCGRAVREQIDNVVALVVHQDRAVGMTPPQGEVIHPQHAGRGPGRDRSPPDQPQDRRPAGRNPQAGEQAAPTCATDDHPEQLDQFRQAQRPAGRRDGNAR